MFVSREKPSDPLISGPHIPGPASLVASALLEAGLTTGILAQEFNVTVPGRKTSVTVPRQFQQPDTDYNIEVLAIEVSGNQTITEGEFSTGPQRR